MVRVGEKRLLDREEWAMNARGTAVSWILLAAYAVATVGGCGGGAATHSTPQAVFDAAKTAAEKEDWKSFSQCLTPESRDATAAAVMLAGVMIQGFSSLGDEKDKAAGKEIESVLKKHGVDPKTMEEPPAAAASKDPKEEMKKVIAPIKDRDAFIGDMISAMNKVSKSKGKGGPMPKDATLKDVKIDGDTATGTITAKDSDKSEEVKFKKIGGSWKMDLDMEKNRQGGADDVKFDGPKFDASKFDEPPKDGLKVDDVIKPSEKKSDEP
jgi:hypothetical protein